MTATVFNKLNIPAELIAVNGNVGALLVTSWLDTDGDGVIDPGELPGVGKTIIIKPVDGGEEITATSDTNGLAFIVLPAGDYRVSRRMSPPFRLSNYPAGYVEVTIKLGETALIGLGTTDKPLVVDKPVPKPIPATTMKVSVCIHEDSFGDIQTLISLKPSGVRYFESPCVRGGSFGLTQLRRAAEFASKGIRAVTMCGLQESGTVNQFPDEGDIEGYFHGVAESRRNYGLTSMHEVEMPNEINLFKYLRLADSDGSKVSDAACRFIVDYARISREQLGPDIIIHGPSIGWNASIAPHLGYYTKLFDLGIGQYINTVNGHFYPGEPTQVIPLAEGLRALADQYKLGLVFTECTIADESSSDDILAVKLTKLRSILQSCGVDEVMAYRIKSILTSKRKRVCFLDETGKVRPAIAAAWGLAGW